MASELQPPGSPLTQHQSLAPPSVSAPPTTDSPPPSLAPKRQRRPSVRLGDIGDQPATLRTAKPWNPNPNSSKTRPLTNLVTAANGHSVFSSDHIIRKDFKSRRGGPSTIAAKEIRTSNSQPGDDPENDAVKDTGYGEGYRDFDPEASDPEPDPDPETQSPLHSADDDTWHARNHNRRSSRLGFGTSTDFGFDSNSVRTWLVGLGLGRYAPVFEIHEVDDEVLPHLTLDDLKDMGINAVGSRRKLYSAILKLRKGLS